ncbi:hypothetical protein K435DRAFT_797873 [Dendrothele bispora CBS 962.96]|uniref:Uncharacterized protein n=1 Tax=Dendrothele bispora (strain CBS 962.96) TaxID=1314807 RepID=A0A4S8M143_DENBC|nr:hypothetical protein K435DRAFT_797873 [Dendrothele bispora CBS 962.96]
MAVLKTYVEVQTIISCIWWKSPYKMEEYLVESKEGTDFDEPPERRFKTMSKETRKGRGWWKSNHLSACGEKKKFRKANEESLKGRNGGRPRGSRPPSGGPPGGGVPGAAPSNRDRKGTAGEEPTASSEAGSSNTRPSGPSSRVVGPPDGGGGKGTRLSELSIILEGSLRGGGGFGGCYTTWPYYFGGPAAVELGQRGGTKFHQDSRLPPEVPELRIKYPPPPFECFLFVAVFAQSDPGRVPVVCVEQVPSLIEIRAKARSPRVFNLKNLSQKWLLKDLEG